ncbi:MAG TPA: hypothetical protein PL001_00125 [Candidatus Kryptobacter bacterium]|nr:hypothetical protein [Candidatus Kryptobacter bacterium]
MALRNQPYLPLYVDDYLTDEKLNECSASTQGIYIKLLCLMHKSEPYGTILLKQKHKQTPKQNKNFASQLARNLLFTELEIELALDELIAEKVIVSETDKIYQKRMVRDNDISEKRKIAGSLGGQKAVLHKQKQEFAQAKVQANSGNEYVNGNGDRNINQSFSPPHLGTNPGPLGDELREKAYQVALAVNGFRKAHGLSPQPKLLDGTEDAVVAVLRTQGKFPIEEITKAAEKQPPLWRLGLFDLDWLCKRSEFGDYNFERVLNYKWQTAEEKPHERLR